MATAKARKNLWTLWAAWTKRHLLAIAIVLGVALLGLLAWAAANAATITLSYVDALRWPVAAVLLIFIFRRPIAALLDRIEKGTLPTPFGAAGFEARTQTTGATPEDEAAPGDRGRPAPVAPPAPVVDNDGAAGQLELVDAHARIVELEANVADLNRQLWLNSALNTIFAAQINLLVALRAAPDGLSIAAVGEFFVQQQQIYALWQASNVGVLLSWPLTSGLIELQADGTYRITDLGRELLTFSENTFWAAKTA